MGLINPLIFFNALLSFFSPTLSFVFIYLLLFYCRKISPLIQASLFVCIYNVYKVLIPDPYIYSDFITYENIPIDTAYLDMPSYWASSYDYLFAALLKSFSILNIDLYDGLILTLAIYVLLVFNFIYSLRGSFRDASFFLLFFSYTSSFQLTRYFLAVTLAYILYLWRPSGILSFFASLFLLLQVHFYSIVNYIIFRFSFYRVLIIIIIIIIIINLNLDRPLIDLIPDFGKYYGAFYSPSSDLKTLLYIFLCLPIFFIRSSPDYLAALKKLILISLIFYVLNETFAQRMLILPFNIFLGLIYSSLVDRTSKLLYLLPILIFSYRYLQI